MRVLYFGTYERDYPRNAQVISALRLSGVEVVEHHVDIWRGKEHKHDVGPGLALPLARAELKLWRSRPPSGFDVVVVGYPGHADLKAARRVASGRPVVFNPMLSLWETFVDDRGRFEPGSIAARTLRRIDRGAFRAADLVVVDTETNADFFARLCELPRDRLAVCFLGTEDSLFKRTWSPPPTFKALFVGKFIPLHGLETIREAARLLPDIPFRIIGSGQLDRLLDSAPSNVEWIRWMDHREVPREYAQAGCALGIFGTTGKAGRVIPNKVFEALACGVPVVTGDTPAARELLTDDDDCLLVPQGDAEGLAEAVQRLADDQGLGTRLGASGRATYESRASEDVLGERWRQLLEEVLAAGPKKR